MAEVVVACPNCHQQYKVLATHVGGQFQCKRCQATFRATPAAGASTTSRPQAGPAGAPSADPFAGLPAAGSDPLAGSRALAPAKAAHSTNGLSLPLVLTAVGGVALLLIVVVVAVVVGFGGSQTETVVATTPSAASPTAISSSPPVPPAVAPAAPSVPPSVPPAQPVSAPPIPPAVGDGAASGPHVPPRGNELSDDPAVLSQQLLDHFERRNALIRSVVDVDSAKAVADRYPAVTDRVNALEAKLRSRLLSDEERQTLDAQFKARLDEGRREWTKEFMRVAAIPGAYENMDPDLAPHADLTPFPTDGEGLLQDAIRSLTKALEAARQVQNAETARKFSGAYRAANARAAPAMAGVRRARKLGINDRNPPQIEELVKQQDVELARIGRIQGLHALFTRGEESPTAPAAASQAAGVRVAKLDLPPSATAFFGQHPDPLLVRLVDVKDHQDRETLDHLISASSPRLSNRLGTANGEILMSPVTDLEGFLAKLTFAEVAVDRTTRVVELRPRYPLPDLSEVAVEQLLPELESGDEQRVINAINRLNHIKPGKGRERIGEALLKLIPIERVRHSAVDGIRHGWLGHEQIARVQKMLPTIQDSGQREQLVIGISKLPDLDEETIGWISGFYPTEHGAVMECWRNIGPAAEPFVQEYLKHPKHEKRKDACKTLGRIGTEASIPLLEQMLSDSDRGVAEEAKKAIEEIKKPEEQREYFKRRAAE